MKTQRRALVLASTTAALAAVTASSLGMAAASPAHGKTVSHAKPSAADDKYATSGSAFGTSLVLGTATSSYDSALSTVGCGATAVRNINQTAATAIPLLGHIGAVTTSAQTSRLHSGVQKTISRVHTADTSLLAGAIKLQAVVSKAVAHGEASNPTSGVVKFVGLKVAGFKLPLAPKPNTALTLPGLGKLILNKQKTEHEGRTTRIQVTALKLTLGHGSLFGAYGTVLEIGHVSASAHSLVTGPLHGTASATMINVGKLVTSGPTFRSHIVCNAAKSEDPPVTGTGLDISNIISTGKITTNAWGLGGNRPGGVTKSSIEDVSLLGGLITAKAIDAQATLTSVGNKIKTSAAGSQLIDLVIDGKQITKNVPVNTEKSLAGIGTLWLNKVTKSHRRMNVHEIEIDLGTSFGGYAAGTVIDVGNANIALPKFLDN